MSAQNDHDDLPVPASNDGGYGYFPGGNSSMLNTMVPPVGPLAENNPARVLIRHG